ncbi:CoA pyrophosphatase [Nocardioides bigeumensis]|uniref:CoA pyrophosphatase n=1 Tax=Nocardioides bigeumensis TaxID=433657 RepID=A0ABN2YTS1_9ACTN
MSEPAAVPGLPGWLRPVADGAAGISAGELSRFVPPPGSDARRGAVLMLFGGETREEGYLLLTERAHHMRSHPGQVSFPGGSVDGDETHVEAALREAWEETGLDPTGVHVFAELPELWLPPSNFAVTTVLGWWHEPTPVDVVDPDEVHAVIVAPIEELLDPAHRFTVRSPRGEWTTPAFMIGPDKDVVLWGFTAGIITRLFDFLGWTRQWDASEVRDVPAYMLQGVDRPLPPPRPAPET